NVEARDVLSRLRALVAIAPHDLARALDEGALFLLGEPLLHFPIGVTRGIAAAEIVEALDAVARRGGVNHGCPCVFVCVSARGRALAKSRGCNCEVPLPGVRTAGEIDAIAGRQPWYFCRVIQALPRETRTRVGRHCAPGILLRVSMRIILAGLTGGSDETSNAGLPLVPAAFAHAPL